MTDWKNDRAEMEMRKSGDQIMLDALVSQAVANGKLAFSAWQEKYFNEDAGFWTNKYQQIEEKVATSLLTKFSINDLDSEYILYIKGKDSEMLNNLQYEE